MLVGLVALAGVLGVRRAMAHIGGSSGPALLGDRSVLSTNACVRYSPTAGDRHGTVFIDPGHGGVDPGASGTAPDGRTLEEKAMTLAVGMDMLPLLRADGYTVIMSRTADTTVRRPGPGDLSGGVYTPSGEHKDIVSRIECANAGNAQLLLSIHFDSYDDPTVGGAETIYDPDRPFHSKSERFAMLVQQSILSGFAAKGWSVPNRFVTLDTEAGTPALTSEGASYGHLLELGPAAAGWLASPSKMPGALTEPLFLTDPGEAAVIESKEGQQALAQALVRAIEEYLGGTKR